MSNPIGETGRTQTTTTSPVTTSTDTESIDSGGQVTSGFSSENSVSLTEGTSSGNTQSGVLLDTPGSTISRDSLLSQALRSRLEGFRSIVSIFNSQFSSDQIDLSDTQTLLLVLRGVISDIKALNSAENIDSDFSTRRYRQAKRSEIAKIQLEINKNKETIDAQSSEILDKQQTLSSKQAVNTDEMSGPEKAQLQSEIDTLRAQIESLSEKVSTLESKNLGLRGVVAVNEVLLVLVENTEFVVDAFVEVKGNGKEELKTGEEKLSKLKYELQLLSALFSKEELQAKLAKDIQRDFNRETIREYDRYSENLNPQGVAAELKSLFTPQLISGLFNVFSEQGSASVTTAISNKGVSSASEQLQEGVAEGLALILLAPPVTASEENPVDQPYLGDSLSLEGANNPQAFTLLLLKERLADIQKALSEKTSLEKATSKTSLKASLDEAGSKASLDEVSSKASLDEASSKASLDEASSKASLDEASSKASLDEASSKASLDEASSKASLDEASSKASLDEASSKASLDEASSKASLDEASSKASLDEASSKASLDEASSKASLGETGSKTSLDEVSSRASLKDSNSERFDDIVAGSPAAEQLAQLIELEREVDAMIVETMKDKELSEATISKSKIV